MRRQLLRVFGVVSALLAAAPGCADDDGGGGASTGGRGGADSSGGGGSRGTGGSGDVGGMGGMGGATAGRVTQVAAGSFHTCALLEPGALRCWGNGAGNVFGDLDSVEFNIGDDELPNSVGTVDVGGTVTQVTAGCAHTCVLLDTGAVRCFGEGFFGQLGYGNIDMIGDDELPSEAGDVDVGGVVTQVAAGCHHTCALLDTGAVRCWGEVLYGKLGYPDLGSIGDDEPPSSAGDVDVGGTVTQVTAGSYHTCALIDTGAVRCWGHGADGRLGYGNTDDVGDDEPPSAAGDVDVGGTVTRVAAAGEHTCALLDTGAVRCWGRAGAGWLGYGDVEDIGDNEPPSSAGDVGVGGPVTQIATGGGHTCARLDTGAVRCWGNAGDGRLGYGNTNDIGDDESPSSAGDVDVGGAVSHVTAGANHVCARLETGAVRCWGEGSGGQLGYGNTDDIGDDEPPSSAGDVQLF